LSQMGDGEGHGSSVDSDRGMLEFFLRAADDVHRYISRLTGGDEQLTEDIVQETFIALMRHRRDGDDAVMGVGWLMQTARHRLIDHVRASQRDSARIERHVVGEPMDESAFEYRSISADQARWMLAQLPLNERIALALQAVDEMTIAEIAAALDRSIDATTSLLARARRRLRALQLEDAR